MLSIFFCLRGIRLPPLRVDAVVIKKSPVRGRCVVDAWLRLSHVTNGALAQGRGLADRQPAAFSSSPESEGSPPIVGFTKACIGGQLGQFQARSISGLRGIGAAVIKKSPVRGRCVVDACCWYWFDRSGPLVKMSHSMQIYSVDLFFAFRIDFSI